ncbi:pyruvate kinase [Candidatus Micrarchaeota archaeon]|nr:pyruvate kinase [Candidatus Micrarchaeota archaeon]MBI5176814.1 pyruvate kinase [Candidatus Micrarchaeota archaeon]
MRRTKIICTIGPSCDDERHLLGLVENGMNVARMNMSHGTHADHAKRIALIRRHAREKGKVVPLLFDIQGPKIRIGMLRGGRVVLRENETVTLTGEAGVEGTERLIPVDFPDFHKFLAPGQRVFLADGMLELRVEKIGGGKAECSVILGGELTSRKGVNIPGADIPLPCLSGKDRKDVEFACKNGADFIGLSFVREAKDVRELRKLIEKHGGNAAIVAKIENSAAYANIDAIIAEADGVMVARGDLGVQLPSEDIPLVQKSIVAKCNREAKPVIIATQMLETMTHAPQPTRAEVSDVANAVLDGADALMLSGETATGRHPVRVVEAMDRIIRKAEATLLHYERMKEFEAESKLEMSHSIAKSVCYTARDLRANAIVCYTHRGNTARFISMYRPFTPIIAATDDESLTRRLELVWGVNPVLIDKPRNTEDLIEKAVKKAEELHLVGREDRVVIAGSTPVGGAGPTNFIKVHIV